MAAFGFEGFAETLPNVPPPFAAVRNVSRLHVTRSSGDALRGMGVVTPTALEQITITAPCPWQVVSRAAKVHCGASSDSQVLSILPFGTMLTANCKCDGMLHCTVDASVPQVSGWVRIVADGELQLLEGDASLGSRWRYRIVLGDGALVRAGLELASPDVGKIPYNSVVEVSERRMNRDGLPRLRVPNGWISEVLNPLSGQRGPVAEIMPLARPLRYRIVYSEGAVVRRDVELASATVRVLGCGAEVDISAKQFSNHPASRCLQRLRLADGSGWISMKINKPDPPDECIAEFVRVADPRRTPPPQQELPPPPLLLPQPHAAARGDAGGGSAVAGSAALAGVAAAGQEAAAAVIQVRAEQGDWWDPFLPVTPPLLASESSLREVREQEKIKGAPLVDDDSCVVCLSGRRTATIVHGDTGHIACCLECARILRARGDACPVCRLPIDRVLQHFWA
ncbi:unnamed protein product [Phaeothamnion confervicola]